MKTRIIKMIFFALVALAGFSLITMLLWNWLIPSIFGLTMINFWQAAGLLILSKILLSGFSSSKMWMAHHRMRAHGMHGGNPIRDKWMNMTPEEKMAFIKKRKEFMHGPFGGKDFFRGGFDFDMNNDSEKGNG